VRVAIATCAGIPDDFEDDRMLAAALAKRGAQVLIARWDDPEVPWDGFDRVIVSTTWDYTRRLGDFLGWVEALDGRVRNEPALIGWNSDKRYLADLEAAGIAVVPTTYIPPGEQLPAMRGEIAVKPAISAGGRDTGRFSPATYDQARELIDRIGASGRTAMVQAYLRDVDERGETALIFFGGRFAHALRKRAVLNPDEVAPVRNDLIGAAEAMYDPSLVTATSATDSELRLAENVLAALRERFGSTPLYLRIDVAPVGGDPVLLELEAIEPGFYFPLAPGSADLLAAEILAS
jgi:hypothetical protein